MPTTNEEILDRQIRHAIFTQRYAGGVSNRVIELLNSTQRDLERALRLRLPDAMENKHRHRKLIAEIKALRKAVYESVGEQLEEELTEFAQYEAGFQLGVIDDAIPVNIQLIQPPAELLNAAVTGKPFQGRILKKWANDLGVSEVRSIEDQINIGMVEGETIDQITRRIIGSRAFKYTDGSLETTRRHASTIARTAVNHTANVARQSVATANEEYIKGVEWISTLDGKTTPICRSRDRKRYPVDSGPRPPAHFGCRSTVTYVIKSWKELGIDLKEAPVGTRASMNGYVAGDVSYGPWLRSQWKKDPGFVEGVLGKKKAKLFIDGKLDIKKFTDRAGNELTLKELRTRQPSAWGKAFGRTATAAPKPQFAYQSYTPMKTVPEIKTWMEANIAGEVSLAKGVTATGLNEVAAGIQEVNERFGMNKVNFVGLPKTVKLQQRYSTNINASFVSAPYNYDLFYFGSRLTNPKARRGMYKTGAQQQSTIRATATTRHIDGEVIQRSKKLNDWQWSISGGVEIKKATRTTTYHEMGHRLHGPDNIYNMEIHGLGRSGEKGGWQYLLTQYSQTNHFEFIAESFALYMDGDKDQYYRLYPPLLEYFQKMDKLKP